MALFEWSDKFSVKIGSIDAQHKKLVDLINSLHSAMLAGQSKTAMSTILGELIKYTESHFTTEERLMRTAKYPGLDEQMREHQTFTKKMKDMAESYEKGTSGLNIELMNFLSDWLKKHILGVDKRYTDHLTAHGVK